MREVLEALVKEFAPKEEGCDWWSDTITMHGKLVSLNLWTDENTAYLTAYPVSVDSEGIHHEDTSSEVRLVTVPFKA